MSTIDSLLTWKECDTCFTKLAHKVCPNQKYQPVVKIALKAIATFATFLVASLPLVFASSTLFAVGLSAGILASFYTLLKSAHEVTGTPAANKTYSL